MDPVAASPELASELLGGLNDVEQRHAPKAIFAVGDRSLLRQRRVAVVGTRSPTPEGSRRTIRLVGELVKEDVVVVSGLASGVDTVAHTTAIERRGKTIAVLGTSLNVEYPRSNAQLQRLIMRDHLAISQFAPGTPTSRKNFPQRNRLMALCSDATVIVEAGDSSGTWSQGWEALRLARPLFLLQSLAERTDLEQVRELRKYGAQVLRSTEQILEQIPPPGAWYNVAADF